MLPIGFLFGFGFNTATEVALFGISATQAANGLSAGTILVFPALYTVSMTLVDTTDGVLMLGAYGWAFTKPIRKLYYNMTITAVSVVVAIGLVVSKRSISSAMNLDLPKEAAFGVQSVLSTTTLAPSDTSLSAFSW